MAGANRSSARQFVQDDGENGTIGADMRDEWREEAARPHRKQPKHEAVDRREDHSNAAAMLAHIRSTAL